VNDPARIVPLVMFQFVYGTQWARNFARRYALCTLPRNYEWVSGDVVLPVDFQFHETPESVNEAARILFEAPMGMEVGEIIETFPWASRYTHPGKMKLLRFLRDRITKIWFTSVRPTHLLRKWDKPGVLVNYSWPDTTLVQRLDKLLFELRFLRKPLYATTV